MINSNCVQYYVILEVRTKVSWNSSETLVNPCQGTCYRIQEDIKLHSVLTFEEISDLKNSIKLSFTKESIAHK
jgi:hypothetical protein